MEETTYSLREIAQFTGLTERTLRNYLEQGLLLGEKQNGAWRFSAGQLEALLQNPAVRPSIQAKNNSYVFDFLLDENKCVDAMCTILDLRADKDEADAISRFFCERVNALSEDGRIHFCFSFQKQHARVILTGSSAVCAQLVQDFYSR